MSIKDTYTKKFLEANGQVADQNLIEAKKIEWWYNVRSKDSGGLRLTDEGIKFVTESLELKSYTVKFPGQFNITPQILVWLDNFIESPYFITKKSITVLSEKSAFELYLFSGDVQKMGYSKALAKRLSQNSPQEN
jgi:hypothetical protein